MKTLKELRHHTYKDSLNARNFHRYVLGIEFEIAFNRAPEKLKDEIIQLTRDRKLYELTKLIRDDTESVLGDFNIRRLREIASKMGIVRYSFMSKSDLLKEISEREKTTT